MSSEIIQQPAELKKPKTVSEMVVAKRASFGALLPRGMDLGQFERGVLAALVKTPKLQQCTATSLLMAVSACAELGLIPNGALGHAYLVPYGADVQFIIGYKGMLQLARRSGQIESISVREVYADDVFKVSYGLHEDLVHEPSDSDNPGPLRGVYCIARFKGGGHHLEYMTNAEIQRVKAGVRINGKSPWNSHYSEMAKKTVLRRAWKMWPCSTEMARAVELEEEEPNEPEDGADVEPVDSVDEMLSPEYSQ